MCVHGAMCGDLAYLSELVRMHLELADMILYLGPFQVTSGLRAESAFCDYGFDFFSPSQSSLGLGSSHDPHTRVQIDRPSFGGDYPRCNFESISGEGRPWGLFL